MFNIFAFTKTIIVSIKMNILQNTFLMFEKKFNVGLCFILQIFSVRQFFDVTGNSLIVSLEGSTLICFLCMCVCNRLKQFISGIIKICITILDQF